MLQLLLNLGLVCTKILLASSSPYPELLVSPDDPRCEIQGPTVFCDFKNTEEVVKMQDTFNTSVEKIFVYNAHNLLLSASTCVNISLHNIGRVKISQGEGNSCPGHVELSAKLTALDRIPLQVNGLYLEESTVEIIRSTASISKLTVINSAIKIINISTPISEGTSAVFQGSTISSLQRIIIGNNSNLLFYKTDIKEIIGEGLILQATGHLVLKESKVETVQPNSIIVGSGALLTIEKSSSDIKVMGAHVHETFDCDERVTHESTTAKYGLDTTPYVCPKQNTYYGAFVSFFLLFLLSALFNVAVVIWFMKMTEKLPFITRPSSEKNKENENINPQITDSGERESLLKTNVIEDTKEVTASESVRPQNEEHLGASAELTDIKQEGIDEERTVSSPLAELHGIETEIRKTGKKELLLETNVTEDTKEIDESESVRPQNAEHLYASAESTDIKQECIDKERTVSSSLAEFHRIETEVRKTEKILASENNENYASIAAIRKPFEDVSQNLEMHYKEHIRKAENFRFGAEKIAGGNFDKKDLNVAEESIDLLNKGKDSTYSYINCRKILAVLERDLTGKEDQIKTYEDISNDALRLWREVQSSVDLFMNPTGKCNNILQLLHDDCKAYLRSRQDEYNAINEKMKDSCRETSISCEDENVCNQEFPAGDLEIKMMAIHKKVLDYLNTHNVSIRDEVNKIIADMNDKFKNVFETVISQKKNLVLCQENYVRDLDILTSNALSFLRMLLTLIRLLSVKYLEEDNLPSTQKENEVKNKGHENENEKTTSSSNGESMAADDLQAQNGT